MAVAAGWLALLPSPGTAQTAKAADAGKVERTITVSATGRTNAEPDIARVTVGIVNKADTAKDAIARNSVAMAKLLEGLKRVSAASDIQTTAINVSPRYTRPKDGRAPTIDGYSAINQVRLTVREIKRLGEVLDQATGLGANQFHQIAFDVANAETLKDEARKQAMENARRRGELYAKASGGQLGPVLRVEETAGGRRPLTIAGFARAGLAQRRSVPIEAGSLNLEVEVQVVYALR